MLVLLLICLCLYLLFSSIVHIYRFNKSTTVEENKRDFQVLEKEATEVFVSHHIKIYDYTLHRDEDIDEHLNYWLNKSQYKDDITYIELGTLYIPGKMDIDSSGRKQGFTDVSTRYIFIGFKKYVLHFDWYTQYKILYSKNK